MICALAERVDGATPERGLRIPLYRLVAGLLYRLDHWLGLPWRCKISHDPVEDETFNWDAMAVEERWLECGRCGLWLRHLPLDGS